MITERDAMLIEFDAATLYSDETKSRLTEKEQFYADGLASQGFTVRFSEAKIFNRKGEGAVISILRSNLQ